MPVLRRNGGLSFTTAREGVGQLVVPEVRHGGDNVPTGTRDRGTTRVPLRYEPIRNGLAFTPYDPSLAGRKARAADPRYDHARRALDAAEAQYGPRPMTLRGLNRNTTGKARTDGAA